MDKETRYANQVIDAARNYTFAKNKEESKKYKLILFEAVANMVNEENKNG